MANRPSLVKISIPINGAAVKAAYFESVMTLRISIFTTLIAALLLLGSSAQSEEMHWPSLSTAPQLERTGENDIAVIVAIEEYLLIPGVAVASCAR